ncbi:hypothetical protein [Pseudomonas sp. 18173]|uniref:hypothetical protein n=1 Tax=Pseudomonas sp. 18173 TaxID=3390055 RepID=UPI003D1F4E73
MNIGPAWYQIPRPQAVQAKAEVDKLEKFEGLIIDEKRVKSTIDKLLTPLQGGMTNEDLDEVEKFLDVVHPDREYMDLRSEIKSFRAVIQWANELRAGDMLREMEKIYSVFKNDLQNKWSGLANKPMGFTVAEDGQLKVTSPPNTLTARDEEILNALLNEAKGLQSLTVKHAKTVIELVKRDKPQFEGKVKLDLSNFHKMVDYGLLLNKGALDLRNSDSWLDQLHKKAEKDPIEKKTGLHIEA